MLDAKIRTYRKELETCWDDIPVTTLRQIGVQFLETKRLGGKIYIMGNGGSASTASHMAVDLRKGAGLPAVSLTDNVALITAWANDKSYEDIFVEQLKDVLTRYDAVIGISASGNSLNILNAIGYACDKGAVTVGFSGMGGGKLHDMVDLGITVSSKNYGVIEDFHLSLNHLLAQYIKEQS